MMRTFQPLAIGIYEAMGGKINNRLVYKHVKSKFNLPVLNFLVAKSFILIPEFVCNQMIYMPFTGIGVDVQVKIG